MQRTDITFHDLPPDILLTIFSRLHPTLLLQLSSYIANWLNELMRGKESVPFWNSIITRQFPNQVAMFQNNKINWLPTHATFFGMFHAEYESFNKFERMALSAIIGRDEAGFKKAIETMQEQKHSIMGFCLCEVKDDTSVLSMIQSWGNQALLDWLYQAELKDPQGFRWNVGLFIWSIACNQPSEQFKEAVDQTALRNLASDCQSFGKLSYNVTGFAVLQNRLDWVKLIQKRDAVILTHPQSAYFTCDLHTSHMRANYNQITLLTIAAKAGHASIVDYLFNNINYPSYTIKMSWFAAVKAGKKDVMECFINKSMIYPDITDQFGQSALLIAAVHGHEEIVDYLLLQNVPLDPKTYSNGYTALTWAIVNDRKNIVCRLMKAGITVSATDRELAPQHGMLDLLDAFHRLSRPQ